MAEEGVSNTVIKEMAVTPREYVQMIRTSAGNHAVVVKEDKILLETSRGILPISLSVLPARRIAALELPVTRVQYDYTGWEPQARRAQQEWLDLHLRRGGG